jgi:PleD family two-component response regulator
MNSQIHQILIVDPHFSDIGVYSHIVKQWSFIQVSSIETALQQLYILKPDLVFISASFSINKNLLLLEAIKNLSSKQLVPIVFVLDLSHQISLVPGTTWGGKIGIIHTLSSKKELHSTLDRVLISE